MAVNFSNTLKITDLNDFIAPSQACVVKDEQRGSVSLNGTEVRVSSFATLLLL